MLSRISAECNVTELHPVGLQFITLVIDIKGTLCSASGEVAELQPAEYSSLYKRVPTVAVK